ncbi:MAG TPA: hypothetical protein VGB43_05825 [Flavobacterium sp.]|jgi:hypothetical protein
MFKLNKLSYENNGRTIIYDYHTSGATAKYFDRKNKFYVTYQEDVSMLPESINVIPLLANVMPIAWFAGFDVYVDSVDKTFNQSLHDLRSEFAVHFPQINPDVKLHVAHVVQNEVAGGNTALLFSGGLDAYESLTRNIEKDPFLISVLGADIDVKDTNRWEDFTRFNEEEKIIKKDRLCYVESNLQTFWTYKVDLLVNIGWWGKIQHGMALISLIAPLSFLKKINTVLIASSNTGEVSFGWGSTSETDEKVKWANISVIHDGFHLRRTEKIENIIEFAKKTGHHIKLRVCYNEYRVGYNCSRCAKCQRTMLGFVLSGENPNDYGFNIPDNLYDLVLKNFGPVSTMTSGVAYEWRCLQEKARHSKDPFIIKDVAAEKDNINTFAALNLNEIVTTDVESGLKMKKLKYILMSKYPGVFKLYMKLRRKF